MYYIYYDHNSNQLISALGKTDQFKYSDQLSAEMKPQQKRFNYFPKLNSVVKYANTGSKYSKLSPKQQSRHSWSQQNNVYYSLLCLWSLYTNYVAGFFC